MSSKKKKVVESKPSCDCHRFDSDAEVRQVRSKLLNWFDSNCRTLPWRTIAQEEADLNKRGYAVWVSEIMLQQTQVVTVIDYYNRWMKKLAFIALFIKVILIAITKNNGIWNMELPGRIS